jgi:excisionase family DNA binding protein
MEQTVETRQVVEPALLSPEDLAVYLGCGRTYAYKLITDGAIPSVKLGRLRRIRRQDADAFVESLAGRDDSGVDRP